MSEVNALLLELQIAEGCTYLSDLHIGGRLNKQVQSANTGYTIRPVLVAGVERGGGLYYRSKTSLPY